MKSYRIVLPKQRSNRMNSTTTVTLYRSHRADSLQARRREGNPSVQTRSLPPTSKTNPSSFSSRKKGRKEEEEKKKTSAPFFLGPHPIISALPFHPHIAFLPHRLLHPGPDGRKGIHLLDLIFVLLFDNLPARPPRLAGAAAAASAILLPARASCMRRGAAATAATRPGRGQAGRRAEA